MKNSILTFFLCLILGTTLVHGAVHVVTPEQDIQTILNSSTSGDLIKLLPGSYGDLSIVNKDITLRSMGSTPVTLGNIEVNGSIVTMIKISSSDLEANDLPGDPAKVIATQGSFGTINLNSSESRLSYCNINHLVVTSGKTITTGCQFDGGSGSGGIGIDAHGPSSYIKVQNCIIRNYSKHTEHGISEECIGIRIHNGANGEIINNVIYQCFDSWGKGWEENCGIGIYVKQNSSATAMGNIIFECFVNNGGNEWGNLNGGDRLVLAEGAINLTNNILWNNRNDLTAHGNIHPALVGGTASLTGNLTAPPSFVNWQQGILELNSNSPAIDAGPPDPQYNDRDGSRNDIGMFGGHNFIPNGRTTDKPIVLGLDVAPIAVPTGGTVTIESTGATLK